ncbi:uncharacterized protein LOC124171575 isoform X1 [Ischnura elegans]|uniref:uncharacterized protein LOC124171575 isoform X1 n=1 Tax=Ischnura elegans TaxID=197161 RepID=UPI001ED89C3F|nr:uncharacterized protein LOC124171575 isoform X1 [Ischnura elegans]
MTDTGSAMKPRREVWADISGVTLAYFVGVTILSLLTSVSGQCFGGTETYEKTTGVEFVYGAAQGLLTQPGTGITRDCTAICRQTITCHAFSVDYENSRCQSYGQDSMGHRNNLHEKAGSNYFEKICIKGVSNMNSMCGDRLWAFERVVGAFLEGFDDREEHNVQTKTECEKLCLFESTFTCRSAEYDESQNICRLSREDRRSQPSSFRRVPGSPLDYLENQCVRSLPDCRYNIRSDSTVISMDELQFAASQAECEVLCDQSRGFTCRSFTYAAEEKRCYLSSDDSISLNNIALIPKRNAVYAEKQCSISQCEDGTFTFAKVTGHFLRSAQSVGLAMASSPGITLECSVRCLEAGSDCPAFSLDYGAMKCFKLDRNTQGRGSELLPREGESFFEKICLRGNVRGCVGKAWAFERRPGKELRGNDDLKLILTQSRRDCMEACLREHRFDCRSAEYDTTTAECRLSREDRRTRPTDYVDTAPTVEYLENQCLPQETRCSLDSVPNSYPRYLDTVLSLVTDEADCERRCKTFSDFSCRSFSYYPSGSQCFISGDDRASAGNEASMTRPGTTYYERNCQVSEHQSHSHGLGLGHGFGPPLSLEPGSGPGVGLGPAIPERPQGPHDSKGGGCVLSGRPEWEKVSGFELQGQRSIGLLYRDRIPGISAHCTQRCLEDPRCRAFNLHYERNDCVGLEANSETSGIDLRATPGVAFFERVCLQAPGCGLVWTFERHPNFELKGFDQVRYPGVSKAECEDRCLEEKQFICRSATYHSRLRECRLSSEDRFTQPQAFIPSVDLDYIENQCAPVLGNCIYRNHQRDRLLIHVDKSVSLFSDSSCQRACDMERDFHCRSYSFLSQTGINTNQCLLSSDASSSVSSGGFQTQSGAMYAERECSVGGGSGIHGGGPQHIGGPQGFNPNVGSPQGPHIGGPHIGGPHGSTDPSVPWPGAPLFGSQPARIPPYGGPGAGKFPQPPIAPFHGHGGPNSGSSLPPHAYEHNDIYGGLYSDNDLNPYPCRYSLTYEKVAGATYANSRREPLRTRGDAGVTAECLVECGQQRERCLAVSLESIRGGRQRCYALDRSADSDKAPLQAAPDLGYFQKICLRERPCTKAWVFTRVPSFELVAPSAVEVPNVPNRRRCQDECLRSARVTCRSATYYAHDRICKISPDTRRTVPEMFRRAGNDVDYMENECASQPPNCEYTDSPGHFLPYTDRFVPRILDVPECRRLCDQEREFPCRSFNFHAGRRECMLSSDDSFTADKAALVKDRDFFYSERGSCSNVRVDCTQADMLITLSFGSPFDGRVYATGNPQACFEMGNSQSQLVLRIPMGTQCGTVQQGRGRYVNHVVIQQNPVIMQNTDKTVRVECRFDASDQTVSYAPKGNRETEGGGISVTVPFRPSGTNLVSNTAPTPSVRMRIVMRGGNEATVVGLGEDLQLRIEIDPGSAFGIFARNLEARTDNGELLTLIDNVGCPRDPNIFPALQIERGTRDLFTDFKAFRFPSTATVNFVATVQFCQDVCEPISCYGGVQSFGRRRRSVKMDESELGWKNESNSILNDNSTTTTSEAYNSTTPTLLRSNNNISKEHSTVTPMSLTGENEAYKSSTESEAVITTTKKTTEVDLPSELPLQLQLVVGEDSLPKILKGGRGDGVNWIKNRGPIIKDSTPHPSWNMKDMDDDDDTCSARPNLIVALLITIALNAAFILAFVMFYRAKRRQWAKETPVHSPPPPPQYFTPEVLFRSVYDRLRPMQSTFSSNVGASMGVSPASTSPPNSIHQTLHTRRK